MFERRVVGKMKFIYYIPYIFVVSVKVIIQEE